MSDREDGIVKTPKQIERVVVVDSLKGKLAALTDEANLALQGMATVSKSDVVNLILEGHSGHLNDTEVEQLKTTHLDQVKFAFWVANRLKQARASGEDLTLNDVLELSQRVMGSSPRAAKRSRKKNLKQTETSADLT